MEKCYIVSTGEYEQSIHRVFKTLTEATLCYDKLKINFIAEWSDLKHYKSIEDVKSQCELEFHITTHFLE